MWLLIFFEEQMVLFVLPKKKVVLFVFQSVNSAENFCLACTEIAPGFFFKVKLQRSWTSTQSLTNSDV